MTRDRCQSSHLSKRYLAIVLVAVAAIVAGSLALAGAAVVRAHAEVRALENQTQSQRSTLDAIDAKTEALRRQLQHVQHQNQEIRQLIGAPVSRQHGVQKTSWRRSGPSLVVVEDHVRALASASSAVQRDSDGVKTLAMRVLNLQHVRDLARAGEIAAIPSIDPVDGAEQHQHVPPGSRPCRGLEQVHPGARPDRMLHQLEQSGQCSRTQTGAEPREHHGEPERCRVPPCQYRRDHVRRTALRRL